MPFYWPAGSTAPIPTWVTITTPSLTACTPSNVWWPNSATQTATTGTTYYTNQLGTSDSNGLAWMQQRNLALQAAQAQHAYAQEQYQFSLYRPDLGQWAPTQQALNNAFFAESPGLAAPAILTHQEGAQRDQEAYRRAVAEHDEQETARLLRVIEDRERTEAERRFILQQQTEAAAERGKIAAAAGERARELLLEHLTPAQRETFIEHGWFVVEGGRSKTLYRIRSAGAAGNIDVMQGGRATARLCCHAQSNIPLGDQWLAQKIMLELAEDDFLRIANRTAV